MTINYIEKIKSIVSVIDFDNSTRHIFEEFLNISADDAKRIYEVIKNIKNIDFPINCSDVKSIFAVSKDKTRPQDVYHLYNKKGENGSLKYIYLEYGGKYTKVIEEAIIPNHINFVKQFLNLTFALGVTLVKGTPPKTKKFNYIIKLKNGTNYYINAKDNSYFFLPFLYRYLIYNLSIYNKKIIENKSTKRLNNIINRTELSKELYEYTKNFFDDFDFIYAVMRSLNTKKRQEVFKTCLLKDESFSNHSKMNDLITYLNTAVYFIKYKMPERFIFLTDRLEKKKQTELE